MDGNNLPTVEDFEELFSTGTPPADPPPTDPPSDPPADPPSDPPADPPADPPQDPPTDPPGGDTPPPATPPAEPPQDRTNQAFAQMRVENNNLRKTIGSLATALKLDPNMPQDQLMNALQGTINQVLAKQSGIPAEVLDKLNKLEEINTKYQEQRLYSKSQTELIELRDEFKLDDKDIEGFMQTLLAEGKNPLVQELDLKREFMDRNYQKIMDQKVAAAVLAEQQRAARAAGQGTTPPAGSGTPPAETGKINSVNDLDTAFNSLNI